MFTNSPKKFAAWFNMTCPGTHRRITTEDVEDMTVCGLIGRYRFYSESLDGETIRAVLQSEQLREKRSTEQLIEANQESPKCKMCGLPLPPEPKIKTGRPKEYCLECESLRNPERQKKLRQGRRK